MVVYVCDRCSREIHFMGAWKEAWGSRRHREDLPKGAATEWRPEDKLWDSLHRLHPPLISWFALIVLEVSGKLTNKYSPICNRSEEPIHQHPTASAVTVVTDRLEGQPGVSTESDWSRPCDKFWGEEAKSKWRLKHKMYLEISVWSGLETIQRSWPLTYLV